MFSILYDHCNDAQTQLLPANSIPNPTNGSGNRKPASRKETRAKSFASRGWKTGPCLGFVQLIVRVWPLASARLHSKLGCMLYVRSNFALESAAESVLQSGLCFMYRLNLFTSSVAVGKWYYFD